MTSDPKASGEMRDEVRCPNCGNEHPADIVTIIPMRPGEPHDELAVTCPENGRRYLAQNGPT